MRRIALLGFIATIVITTPVSADDAAGIKLDKQQTQKWRVGVEVTAPNGFCFGILATLPVPTDWPEQSTRIIDEEVSSHVQGIKYRVLNGGVKQMLVSIPQLAPGDTATAYVNVEVTRSSTLGPDDPDQFVLPKRVPRDIGKFLAASPYIESRHGEITKVARKIVDKDDTAWQQVETIYDWVRDNVEYKDGKLKGALAALRDGDGDCEELTSLFIALCRANKIPARTVWIPDHCYPEFYLLDGDGQGHWFPCQAAGTRDFGGMPEFRPILQKGDNFNVPEKKGPQRYVAEFIKIKAVRGSGDPKVKFERQLLAAE